MNPYELGMKHATEGRESENPFDDFSEKWVLYNRGYNKIANPWATK